MSCCPRPFFSGFEGKIVASKESKIFHITINDWVFYDPKFKKNYSGYFPISRSFYSSKIAEKLTNAQFTYLIALIDLAHTYRSPFFDLPETLLRANGQLVESLLSRLQQNQILSFSTNKEIKELINKDNQGLEGVEILEENFSEYFQKFVTQKMGSMDLGFVQNYHQKAKKAFVTIAGFDEFASQVMGSKTFGEIELNGQMSYFKKSLKDELRDRGCL